MKSRKILVLLAVIMLCAGLLSGCKSDNGDSGTVQTSVEEELSDNGSESDDSKENESETDEMSIEDDTEIELEEGETVVGM